MNAVRERRQFFGYTCPKCDNYNSTAGGFVRNGLVTVRCKACGFIERFQEGEDV